ncbi:MAG: hypothetical protein ISS44_01890 [Candidatus Omnitrophica bacterium]|nr:hypothetical protein [Candidatus Omnitrophota bacterium]
MRKHRLQRLKQIAQILILVTGYWLLVTSIEAAIWERIPVFPQAERIKEEETLVNNIPAQISIYSTVVPPEEVIEFYKTKLTNFGWSLVKETNQQGINLIVFSKKDKFVNITVQDILGKNFITTTQGKAPEELPEEASSCPDCQKGLKTFEGQGIGVLEEDTPGQDLEFVPRYPGSIRANVTERKNGKKVTLSYYSQDSVEDVINFYRQNMGYYHWVLENELDLTNLPESLSTQLPISFNGRSLTFKSSFASCIINIFEEPQAKGTIIGIVYNEK